MRRALPRLAFALLVSACGPAEPDLDAGVVDDAGIRDSAVLDGGADAGEPGLLRAEPGVSRYAEIDEEVVLDGSDSVGALRYQWFFGDGRRWDEPREEATARVSYDSPGRYRATLTVYGLEGRRHTAQIIISVTAPRRFDPESSASVAVAADRDEVMVASTDADEVTLFRFGDAFEVVRHVSVLAEPRSVIRFGGRWVVTCQAASALALVDDEGELEIVSLPPATRPFGVVSSGDALYVTLQATGELIRLRGEPLAIDARWPAIPDARGIARLPGGRLVITRWRSPDERGELFFFDPEREEGEVQALAFDPRPASDTASGGVPSYLEQVAVEPSGERLFVPSTQAAIGEGLTRNERPMTHESTVRAVLSVYDIETSTEDFETRRIFDNRDFAAAAALSSRGDFLYVAMRGTRTVERIDALTGIAAGSVLDIGFAPRGLALSPDDRLLFVDAFLSRELVVLDVSDPAAVPSVLARLSSASREPLSPEVLRGKQLFNDSFDPRLARDHYVACAGCHLEGMADARTWDFTDRGEGLRNTIDLFGRAGMGHGPLHWSANFDEVQDFEHDIRGASRGHGLMSDADFFTGTRDQPLGDPKAGVSEDLDALAAYVSSLVAYLPSPHRLADGSLPEAAIRGRAHFEASGCPSCHAGPSLTDSAFDAEGRPRLHDVGTLRETSGQRLGAALEGIDTPTLHGLWQSAPYLHDGSAPDLHAVLRERNPGDAHGSTSGLSDTELDDLVAYLLCLDGRVD